MKIAIISLFVMISITSSAMAEEEVMERYPGSNGYRLTLSAYVGQKYGLGSSAFFDDYSSYFGGKNLSFPLVPTFGAAAKMELLPNVRFGVGGEHFSASFTDNYSQPVFLNPSDMVPLANREISQRYSLTINSVLFTAEYIPVASPYRTYAGIGAGVSFGAVLWSETMHSTDMHDKRVGGQYLNDNAAGPAAALYVGVELAFDRTKHDGNLTLLAIEARYTAIGISRPIFARAARQFAVSPSYWSESAPIGASGLTLQLGLAFQIAPRRK